MAASEPIRDDELDTIFTPCPSKILILAVSGGSDSVALMHLASTWARRCGRQAPALLVATVDHGLRAGSRAEAEQVAAWATALGLPHRLLVWDEAKPTAAIQARARVARYRLLRQLAGGFERPALVTAHTQEDQAETLLMRLARGSGVDGLASMPTIQSSGALPGTIDPRGSDVMLWRPLLTLGKERLRATLRACGAPWIEDPSNHDPAFERVRLRKAAPVLADVGLVPERVAASARRLSRARSALEHIASSLWRGLVDLNGGAFARIALQPWSAQPEELRIRLLRSALHAFGGSSEPVPLEKAERLSAWIDARACRHATIAGCRVEMAEREGSILVWREAGRRGFPEVLARSGDRVIWDNRFEILLPLGPCQPWRITSFNIEDLGSGDRKIVRSSNIPARIARTLPAVWSGKNIVEIPLLGVSLSPQDDDVIRRPIVRFLHHEPS